MIRRIFYLILFTGVAAFIALYLSNNLVSNAADEFTYNDPDLIPEAKTGLLLGTSKYLKNGDENLYFQNRIAARYNVKNQLSILCREVWY